MTDISNFLSSMSWRGSFFHSSDAQEKPLLLRTSLLKPIRIARFKVLLLIILTRIIEFNCTIDSLSLSLSLGKGLTNNKKFGLKNITYTNIVIGYPIARRFTTNFQKDWSIWKPEVIEEFIISLLKLPVILHIQVQSKSEHDAHHIFDQVAITNNLKRSFVRGLHHKKGWTE